MHSGPTDRGPDFRGANTFRLHASLTVFLTDDGLRKKMDLNVCVSEKLLNSISVKIKTNGSD